MYLPRNQFTAAPPPAVRPTAPLPVVSPQKIAVMLPLSGPLGKAGIAIKEGMLAQIDEFENSSHQNTSISWIDTGNEDHISVSLAAAENSQPSLIVGPLTKRGVEDLSKLSPKAPTITLNSASSLPRNVYSFSLQPEEEGKNLANHLYNKGFRQILLITGTNLTEKRTEVGFSSGFSQLRGHIYRKIPFTNMQNFSKTLRHELHIDESEQQQKKLQAEEKRKVQLKEVLKLPEIDAVVLILNGEDAKLVKSLLKFYYVSAPVYASTTIFENLNVPDRNLLAGIHVFTSPWSMQNLASPLRNQLEETYPLDFNENENLYGLGVDAAKLVFYFEALKKGHTIPGVLGNLRLSSGNKIERFLEEAMFDQAGDIKPL